MQYSSIINNKIKSIDENLIQLNYGIHKKKKPTSASSEFLINKAQGDWAEKEFLDKSNEFFEDYTFVKYGVNNDLIAGEDGFDNYYEKYLSEINLIGKKPDILVFKTKDFPKSSNLDISELGLKEQEVFLKNAIAGLEIRSSNFYEEKYKNESELKRSSKISEILNLRNEIIDIDENGLEKDLEQELINLNEKNINDLNFRIKIKKNIENYEFVKERLKKIKEELKYIKKRDYLSFTPKAEDLNLVNKWIDTYNIPHFYVQVFIDSLYVISFEKILDFLNNKEFNKNKFFIEKDVKNQNKTTVKISVKDGIKIGKNDVFPNLFPKTKVLKNGKCISYIEYKDSEFKFEKENFINLINQKKKSL